jgi:hypothetical protein
MARKVFQDFANVLCQKFVELPTNRDLVNLVILGDGKLVLEVTAGRATHNRYPIETLPYGDWARAWLGERMSALQIPKEQLVHAILTVDYTVTLVRKPGMLIGQFAFACAGIIEAPDRTYESSLEAKKEWGLSPV